MKIYYYLLSMLILPLSAMDNTQELQHIVLLDHQSYEEYRQEVFRAVEVGQNLSDQHNDAIWFYRQLKERIENPEVDSYMQLFSEEERTYINQIYGQFFSDFKCKEKYEFALNRATDSAWNDFIKRAIKITIQSAIKKGIACGDNYYLEKFLKQNSKLKPEAINYLKTQVIAFYLHQMKRVNVKPQQQN